jgi:hypothetical protein
LAHVSRTSLILAVVTALALAGSTEIYLARREGRVAAATRARANERGQRAQQASGSRELDLAGEPAEVERTESAAAAPAATIDVRGRVVDELGAAVEAFGVRALELDVEPAAPREWPSGAHAGGEFELLGLAPGTWEIWVFAEGLRLDQAAVVKSTELERIEFLMRGTALVHGVVLDAQAHPLVGAEISIDGRAERQATDSGGNFHVELGLGEHVLVGRASGFLPSRPLDLRVDSRAGIGNVELVLQRGGTLRGTVLDEANLPVSDCVMTALARPDAVSTTDARGQFEIAGLAPGQAVLTLRVPLAGSGQEDRWYGTANIEAERATEIVVRIARERWVRIAGRVEGDALDIFGTRIHAVPIGGQFVRASGTEAAVAADGTFELKLSSAGKFRLDRIAMFSEEIASTTIDVPDRDVFEVTLKP